MMLIALNLLALANEHGRHSRYKLVRGALDFSGVANRTASRSKYGGESAHPLTLSTCSPFPALSSISSPSDLWGVTLI